VQKTGNDGSDSFQDDFEGGDEEEEFRLHTFEKAGRSFIVAEGDVDLATADELRAVLTDTCRAVTAAAEPGGEEGSVCAAGAAGAPTVVVDLREVHFIDSAGLAVLMEVRRLFYEKCGLALIVAEGSQPARVIRLSRFEMYLRVVNTPEELDAPAPAGLAR
jgi:anti-anti-sigma factor